VLAALFEDDLDNIDEERDLDFLGRPSLGCVAKIEFRTVGLQNTVLIYLLLFSSKKKVGKWDSK
jgi:hypothetical protein